MKLIFLLFISINAQAGLFDFFNIHQANKAYQDKDYKKAATQFSKIDHNDAARLNQANSLYKQGLYKQALIKYRGIKQEDLAFDRLYNSGNAYAKSGKINESINSYEAALKLKKDDDALFNLELLKKQKKGKAMSDFLVKLKNTILYLQYQEPLLFHKKEPHQLADMVGCSEKSFYTLLLRAGISVYEERECFNTMLVSVKSLSTALTKDTNPSFNTMLVSVKCSKLRD